MIVITAEQKTAAWFDARRGIPTGSGLASIITPKGAAVTGAARQKYMRKLLYERLTGHEPTGFETYPMRRGNELEADARNAFIFETGLDVVQTGFCRHDTIACGVSPDGLIGTDSGLEIKTAMADGYIDKLITGNIPDENVVQIQACLWVTGRDTWNYWLYDPELPCLHVTARRNDKIIAALETQVPIFVDELNALEIEIRSRYDCAAIRDGEI